MQHENVNKHCRLCKTAHKTRETLIPPANFPQVKRRVSSQGEKEIFSTYFFVASYQYSSLFSSRLILLVFVNEFDWLRSIETNHFQTNFNNNNNDIFRSISIFVFYQFCSNSQRPRRISRKFNFLLISFIDSDFSFRDGRLNIRDWSILFSF